MNLIEIMKAKGISEDIIKAVQEDMKANKVFTASEENLDIRYGKLKTEHESKLTELTEANNLIAELKKNNKGNEGLQQKVTEYEGTVAQLQEELLKTKLESAVHVELLAAKAIADDIDYLAFKLKEKGELELDENGKIKGWDDKLAGLKTQFPTHFESAGGKKYDEHKLPEQQDGGHALSKEAFSKMGYQDRLKLYNENPEAYAELNK
jgi:hypothetical protein